MKHLSVLLLFMYSSVLVNAQASSGEADTLQLKEIVVQGEKVVKRPDGLLVYPSAAQKSSSFSAYSLLRKLALPQLKVDDVMNTITTTASLGSVEVRINGKKATVNELRTVDIQAIKSVEYISSPGVRYGADVVCVINIRVMTAYGGWAMGADLMSGLTAGLCDWAAYGKVNGRLGELSVNYFGDYNNMIGSRITEEGTYSLSSGDDVLVSRKDRICNSHSSNHHIQVKHSYAGETGNVLQTTVGLNVSAYPKYYNMCDVFKSDGTSYSLLNDNTYKTATPVLDLYGLVNLSDAKTLTLSANCQYAKTSNRIYMYNTSDGIYAYNVKGKAYSLNTEILYDYKLKPFVFSAGIQLLQNYVNNGYSGNVVQMSVMHASDIYAFAQIKGAIRKFSYSLGAGFGRQYVRSGNESDVDFTFRPKLNLSFNVTERLMARYTFGCVPYTSRMQYVSNVAVKTNDMELTAGNPNLHPYSRVEHNIDLSYSDKRLYSQVYAFYRGNYNCALQKIYRTVDDKFVFSRKNQGNCNMFIVANYTSYDIIPQHFSAFADAGLYRMYNYGDTYKHHYTSCSVSLGMNAYIGKWTFMAGFDSGFRNLEGETVYRSGYSSYLNVSFRIGQFNIVAYWSDIFNDNRKVRESEVVSSIVHKKIVQRSTDLGNLVGIKISWNISKGRKYKDIRVTGHQSKIDTGVIENR